MSKTINSRPPSFVHSLSCPDGINSNRSSEFGVLVLNAR